MACYLFHNLDQSQTKVTRHEVLNDDAIQERILDLGAVSHIVEPDKDGLKMAHSLRDFITKPSIESLTEDLLLDS